jgi:LPXTG-motif cell wall-anchored protein
VRRALPLFALVASLVAAPLASAHGGGKGDGYTSAVQRIVPAVAGLKVQVVQGDDQLKLTNETGRQVTVLGYGDEPYLRFDSGRIQVNLHSPAYYVNQDRYGKTAVPPEANEQAAPKWKEIGSGPTYAWHDHRIHWMSTIAPPVVKADPKQPHHVFNWKVPARVGSSPVTIAGSLDYTPPPAASSSVAIYAGIGAGVALILLGGGWFLFRRRRQAAPAPRTRML